MALPLSPADMFEQELQIIQEEADTVSAEYPAVLQFTVYLRHTWLPLKDKVFVFGTSIGTNNLVEFSFYDFSQTVEFILIFGIFFIRIAYFIVTAFMQYIFLQYIYNDFCR